MKAKHTLARILAALMCAASPAVLAEEVIEVQEPPAKEVITGIDMEAIAAELGVEVAVIEKAVEVDPDLFVRAGYAGDMVVLGELAEKAALMAEETALPNPNIFRFGWLANGIH